MRAAERTSVAVPENAVRDEPIAFGLTGAQLGILVGAALAALIVNLLPVPGLVRVVLVMVLIGPIVVAALLPIAGEPAYRSLIRAVRYRTGNRLWRAESVGSDKAQISGEGDTGRPEPDVRPDAASMPPEAAAHEPPERPADGMRRPEPLPQAHAVGTAARLRLLEPDAPDAELGLPSPGPADRDDGPIPHLIAGLRVVTVVSFAGGVGKTSLAVELATLLAARGRYRTLDGGDHAVSVLVLDAARLAPAVGLRLGLAPSVLAKLPITDWGAPDVLARAPVVGPGGPTVVALPPSLPLDGQEGLRFGAVEAARILDGAARAGIGLVIADLGAVHEDGHRHLIDQSSLVIGVVRSDIASLPDVLRLATYLRGLGMGRKLAVVANAADDDREIRRLASETDIPVLGRVRPSASYAMAADRGEAAWRLDPSVEADLLPIAASIWPLTGAVGRSASTVGTALGRMRDTLRAMVR